MNLNETTDSIDEKQRSDAQHSTTNGRLSDRLGRRLLLLGTPILLGVLFIIHPDGSGGFDALHPIADTWLLLHVAMLPLLGLLGVSFYLLLQDYSGTVATVGRVGVAIYMTFYIAFEAIAGITTGLLVHDAHAHPAEQQEGIAAVIELLMTPSVALGIVGSLGALVAVVSAGILFRRSGAPLVPVLMLGGAPLATIFHGGTPLDAVGMGVFLVGVTWLELNWRRSDEHRSTQTP